MNNSQFRSLLSQSSTPSKSPNGAGSSTPSMRPPTLGSRARSSIPMTPRTVAGSSHIDFRRQLSDMNEPPTKKFKSSGPKGVKLGKGYVDRSQALRTGTSGEDGETGEKSKEERLKNLEEMYKLQQIDGEMLESMRRELGVGGRVETSHLVKGLDWELLKRVRGGEDVLGTEDEEGKEEEEGKGDVDIEDELDGVLSHEMQAKGMDEATSTTTAPLHSEEIQPQSEVLSRDEILRRLKASRSAVAMPPPPLNATLNDRFKKVGSDSIVKKKRFTEFVKGRKREVLLTTDKEGRSKRKVRWLDLPWSQPPVEEAVEPAREVMGMEVPAEIAARQRAALELQKAEEEQDDDIFAGVGAEYDPLGDLGSDEEGDMDDEVTTKTTQPVASEEGKETNDKPRNYFGGTTENEKDSSHPIANDPTILAALKRAAALRQAEGAGADKDNAEDANEDEEHDPERALKRKAFLEKLKQQQADDARDLDMGFGESRFGDEEDEDGPLYGSGDEKREKRKRAPKKRRGDKENVKDVLGVLEGRKTK